MKKQMKAGTLGKRIDELVSRKISLEKKFRRDIDELHLAGDTLNNWFTKKTAPAETRTGQFLANTFISIAERLFNRWVEKRK